MAKYIVVQPVSAFMWTEWHKRYIELSAGAVVYPNLRRPLEAGSAWTNTLRFLDVVQIAIAER
ncbi:hypothetical protein EV356DRAFT_496861 [Viridothelium virens]|uniref:Uncharacterized protein n=1 Tax=Viridothelium virens TaxID=1048519 RepID=A0A6A6HGM1_VIRVR|nr:hypothetical protein EV356DRAFT_496861 [Viridothelium virens]